MRVFLLCLCVGLLLGQESLQSALKKAGLGAVVQRVVDLNQDYKLVVLEKGDKWEIWWLDKHTGKLDSKAPAYAQGSLQQQTEDEVHAHNQVMPLKMWKLFNPPDPEVARFDQTLLSLVALKGTSWEVALFDGPSAWLVNSDYSQAVEVGRAFGQDTILFNQIGARLKKASQESERALFASFFEAVPQSYLSTLESSNPKAPELYIVLSFVRDEKNLYTRTGELLEKLPRIAQHYRVHILPLFDNAFYVLWQRLHCLRDNASKIALLKQFYVFGGKNDNAPKDCDRSTQEHYAGLAICGVAPSCPKLPDNPKSKKVRNTGMDWFQFLYGWGDENTDGYLNPDTPAPLLYDPKLGLLDVASFLGGF